MVCSPASPAYISPWVSNGLVSQSEPITCTESLAKTSERLTVSPHDREAALVQGLTHLIAKILVAMEPLPRRMTTASFDLLMRATEMVRHDSPAVFMAIEQANPHARPVRDRFFALAEEMRAHLDRDAAESFDQRDAGALSWKERVG